MPSLRGTPSDVYSQGVLGRTDTLGFGHDAIMSWHEAAPGRPKFLFKLKLTNLVRSALHRIKESNWQGPAILGACQMAEGRIQLTGWKTVSVVPSASEVGLALGLFLISQ